MFIYQNFIYQVCRVWQTRRENENIFGYSVMYVTQNISMQVMQSTFYKNLKKIGDNIHGPLYQETDNRTSIGFKKKYTSKSKER